MQQADDEVDRAVYTAALERLKKAIERVATYPSVEALQEADDAREQAYRLYEVIRVRSEARAQKHQATTTGKNTNYVMPKKLKSEALAEAAARLRATADLLMAIDERFLGTAIHHFYIQTHNKARKALSEEICQQAEEEKKND